MKNYEFTESSGNERIKISKLGQDFLVQSIHFITAGLLASVTAEQFFSPLGIAFCSATKRKNTLLACLGAMLGYIVSNDYLSAFRYVMALIIVYILKVYVNAFDGLRDRVAVPPAIAFFSAASTGAVVMIVSPFDMNEMLLRAAETLTAFGVCYFFTVAFTTSDKLTAKTRLSNREITSLLIALMIVILSMTRFSFFGVSPSGIICSYIVMVSAYVFNENGGAIIGTGASLGFWVTGNNSPLAFCYGAAGLFAGLFSYSGRVLSAMAYIFSYGAVFLLLGGKSENGALLAETASASILFILTPQNVFEGIKNVFGRSSFSGDGEAVRDMLVTRLKMVKSAVGGVSGTVAKVSKILKEKAPPDTAGVYLRVRDTVCDGCAVYEKCWKSGFAGTVAEFDAMLEEIRKNEKITPSFAPASLSNRCLRIMSLCDSFNKNYSSYSARLGAEGRINEMRKITVDQFGSVCDMIDDLLIDFERGARPLSEKSNEIKNSLDNIGAEGFVICYEVSGGNMLVSVTLRGDCRASDDDIAECIENVTEREFSSPVEVENETEKVLMFWEKPAFSVECEYYQLSADDGDICGDCFDSFYDGRGNFIAVLSDGMGTGSHAAIDGAMASSLLARLIISGFSFPCALKLVNSAMLVKSRDESLATLDILKINLYTGQATIYKAGAASSLMKRMGKVSEIKKSAMPIGILRQAEFATVRGGLHDSDLIVMMSDGAADIAVDEMKRFLGDNAYSDELAQKLCVLAKSRNVGRCDDITVASVRVQKVKAATP